METGRAKDDLEEMLQRQKNELEAAKTVIHLAKQHEKEQQQKIDDTNKKLENTKAKLDRVSDEANELRVKLKESTERQKLLENQNKRSAEDIRVLEDKIKSMEAQIQLYKLNVLDAQRELETKSRLCAMCRVNYIG